MKALQKRALLNLVVLEEKDTARRLQVTIEKTQKQLETPTYILTTKG
jgi:hypothetical protein